MNNSQASNRRSARRSEEMKFAYSGPFVRLLNPIRTLPITEERYTPTSAEKYTIGSRVGTKVRTELERRFVRRPRRSRRAAA